MKTTLIFLIIVCTPFLLSAETINAVTESGEEVILYPNGTWKYKNKLKPKNEEIIVLSPRQFNKDKNATFLVKSQNLNIGIWLNPKVWRFKKNVNENKAAEYNFSKRSGELYGMLITEKISIPLNTLKEIALENAKEAAPNARIDKQEYRKVNGTTVLMMKLSGTIRGVEFIYFGYYFSNKNGTVQFLAYTAKSLFNTHFRNIETFLNGFVVLPKE